jgi:hypothetical protein
MFGHKDMAKSVTMGVMDVASAGTAPCVGVLSAMQKNAAVAQTAFIFLGLISIILFLF